MDMVDLTTPLPTGINAKRRPLDVFASKLVAQDSGCIEWSGKLFRNGYGCFGLKGRCLLAHRVAYFIANGELPGVGKLVMHTCDNRKCCNPAHLTSGTQAENMQDMHHKGRANSLRGEDSFRARMTDSGVRQLRQMRWNLGMIYKDIAKYFSISGKQANLIANRVQWAHVQD